MNIPIKLTAHHETDENVDTIHSLLNTPIRNATERKFFQSEENDDEGKM